jgi:hypothetical protein
MHQRQFILALSAQAIKRYHATEPVFAHVRELGVRRRKICDDAEDDAAVPIHALRALEEALNVFAVDGEFIGKPVVNNEIYDGSAFRENEKDNDDADTEGYSAFDFVHVENLPEGGNMEIVWE